MVKILRLTCIITGIMLILMSAFIVSLRRYPAGDWLLYHQFGTSLTLITQTDGDESSARFWFDDPILVDPVNTGYALLGITPDHRRFTLNRAGRTPGNAGLLQMDISGGELHNPLRQLAREYRAYNGSPIVYANYSPDGNWIALSIESPGQSQYYSLFVITSEGENPLLLVENVERVGDLLWSPDGQWIAYSASHPGRNQQRDIHIIKRDGSETRQLSDFYGCFCVPGGWSPDSQWLTFSTEDGLRDPALPRNFEMFEIYRAHVDGQQLERLTNTGNNKVFRGWSRSGEWLIFANITGMYAPQLFGINIVTGEQKPFTRPGAYYFVDWAGDVMIIDFDLPYREHIVSMEPDSGVEVMLAPEGRLEYITESGEWIYYFAGTENSDLFRVRTDGRGRQQLTQGRESLRIIGEIPAVDLRYQPVMSMAAGMIVLLGGMLSTRLTRLRS